MFIFQSRVTHVHLPVPCNARKGIKCPFPLPIFYLATCTEMNNSLPFFISQLLKTRGKKYKFVFILVSQHAENIFVFNIQKNAKCFQFIVSLTRREFKTVLWVSISQSHKTVACDYAVKRSTEYVLKMTKLSEIPWD